MFLVQLYEDDSKYEGMMLNDMKNGQGKLMYPDGVYY